MKLTTSSPATLCASLLAGTAAAQGAGNDEVVQLDEVVITAQRFEENVQRASVSLQVLDAAALDRGGVTQAVDLVKLVPGLQIGTGGGAPQIYIRGVGDFAASALSNPAVAVNVDGVYVARPQGVNSAFYDLARLEVLRGPQGTLYGRNASGGALNLVTQSPSLSGKSGYGSLTLGNFNLRQLEGALNLPLSDTLAVRGAFQVVDRDGYLSDGTDDDDRQSGRLRMLWQPGEEFSLRVNADYSREKGQGPGYVQLPRNGLDPWLSASSPEANGQLAATPPIGFLVSPVGDDSFRDNRFWNISAEANWDFGPATLTVLPAHRDVRISERNYPAGLRNTIPEATSKQDSIEARLSNTTDRLKWVAGFYWFDEDQDALQNIYQGILQDNNGQYSPSTESHAAFGQATFSLADEFRLIAGARYTEDKSSVTGSLTTNSPNGLPPGTPLPALLATFGGERTFSDTTWKAGFEYDVTDGSMLFGTVSTGFKAGGFNQTVTPMDTYEPEKITDYTLGLRNRFFENRLQLNVEAFHWKYDDNQIAHVVFDPLGNINLVTQNAGRATIQGFNVDVVARPSAADTVRAFVEYNDATYKEFIYSSAYSIFGTPLFNPASTGCPAGAPYDGELFGTQLVDIDCSGFDLPRAPQWTGSLGWDHSISFAGGTGLVLGVSAQYVGERWLGFEFVSNQRAKAVTTLDLDVTWLSADDTWSVSGFVRNVTDEAVYTGGAVQGFAPPLVYATIAAPRTYGLRLRYELR